MLKVLIWKHILCQMMKTDYKHYEQCSDKFLWKAGNTKMQSVAKAISKTKVNMDAVFSKNKLGINNFIFDELRSTQKDYGGFRLFLILMLSVLTIMRLISRNLFLPKVTRKKTRSSASFRETLGRS